MKVKEFIKTNWKIIIIISLAVLFMSKCTTSCAKTQKIKMLTTESISKDSIITVYEDSIKYLNIENDNLNTLLNSEQNHANAFSGIAIGNLKELNETIKRLQVENKKLIEANKQLQKQLEDCK